MPGTPAAPFFPIVYQGRLDEVALFCGLDGFIR